MYFFISIVLLIITIPSMCALAIGIDIIAKKKKRKLKKILFFFRDREQDKDYVSLASLRFQYIIFLIYILLILLSLLNEFVFNSPIITYYLLRSELHSIGFTALLAYWVCYISVFILPKK